jgi:curved DNA-binding protein CbpA
MAANSFKDYYADLGLELGASDGAIKKAFHDLAKKHHPDKSGVADAAVFRRVREAFEQLSNPEYRTQYDRTYWGRKFQTDAPSEQENYGGGYEGFGGTRTAQPEADACEEAGRASPPPVKPQRRPDEPSWQYFLGKAYTTWQKEDAAYRMRHPDVNERCVGLIFFMADIR